MAVLFNREEEALKWLEIAVELYPEKMTWGPEFDPETDTVDLEKLVRARLEDDIQRGGDYQVQAILIGMLVKHFTYLAWEMKIMPSSITSLLNEFTRGMWNALRIHQNEWACLHWKIYGGRA